MATCFGLLAAWGWREFDSPLPVLAMTFVIWLCPFLAAGALFGRPLVGLLIGAVLVGAYTTFVAIMLL
jgi:hypothetical protein